MYKKVLYIDLFLYLWGVKFKIETNNNNQIHNIMEALNYKTVQSKKFHNEFIHEISEGNEDVANSMMKSVKKLGLDDDTDFYTILNSTYEEYLDLF